MMNAMSTLEGICYNLFVALQSHEIPIKMMDRNRMKVMVLMEMMTSVGQLICQIWHSKKPT